MEIQNKSFMNGMSWVFNSLKVCTTNFIRFLIPAILSFICVALVAVLCELFLSLILGKILPANIALFIAGIFGLVIGIIQFIYLVGYIRIVKGMLNGDMITFKSFFEIFKDKQLCLKLIPFYFTASVLCFVILGLYSYIAYKIIFAVQSAVVVIPLVFVGAVLALVLFATVYFALILFVSRKEAKIFATFIDSFKAINRNIMPFLGVLVALMIVYLIAYILILIFNFIMIKFVGILGTVIVIITGLILFVYFMMFYVATLVKTVNEICHE